MRTFLISLMTLCVISEANAECVSPEGMITKLNNTLTEKSLINQVDRIVSKIEVISKYETIAFKRYVAREFGIELPKSDFVQIYHHPEKSKSKLDKEISEMKKIKEDEPTVSFVFFEQNCAIKTHTIPLRVWDGFKEATAEF